MSTSSQSANGRPRSTNRTLLKALYVGALFVAATSFSLSIAAMLSTKWIHFVTPHSSPITLTTDYGLFQRCDSSSWVEGVTCRKFPTRSQDCGGSRVTGATEVETMEKRKRLGKHDDEDDWGFCDSWVSAGYATQLSLVFGLASILASLIVVIGGRAKREGGWRVVSGLLSIHAACLIVATSLIAHEYNTDDLFFFGSKLGQGFVMATTAWSLDVVVVLGLILVGAVGLVREDDYERIRD